jgi:hypothetical protein
MLELVVFILLITFPSMIWAASLARAKGRSEAGAVLLALFLPVLGLIVVAFQAPNWAVVRRCRCCGTVFVRVAQRCPACQAPVVD